jgi:hypothetical protein
VGAIKGMVGSGLLDRPDRGILRVVGGSETWQQGLRIALLRAGAGAVASHRSAARLLGLEGCQSPHIELSVPPDHRRRPRRTRLHESTDLNSGQVIGRDAMRVTNAARTLVDLGSVVSEALLEVALDDALRRG